VTLVDNPGTCIIDASTAHRTDPAWTFGLPELAPGQRAKLRAAKRIANPGCHASAFILAVKPLVAAGILQPDYPLAAHSITGYSGGGKKMIAQYEAAAPASNAPRPYALGLAHKHLPEMAEHTGLTAMHPSSSRSSGRSTRAWPSPPSCTQRQFTKPMARRPTCRSSPIITPANPSSASRRSTTGRQLIGGFFNVEASNDTNRVDLFVFGNEERMLVVGRLDNLGKGASGAAVQAMNVHLGVEESLGLV
jgi:N-acetyl-gamma-glutamyl-phosphate reductase